MKIILFAQSLIDVHKIDNLGTQKFAIFGFKFNNFWDTKVNNFSTQN